MLQRLTYQAFGGVRTTKGEGARTSYIGREEDNESGLGFYGVRLFEPEYGRFTSVDSLTEDTNQVDKSPYSAFWGNPLYYPDTDEKCHIYPWADAFIDAVFVAFDIGEITNEYI